MKLDIIHEIRHKRKRKVMKKFIIFRFLSVLILPQNGEKIKNGTVVGEVVYRIYATDYVQS